MTGSVWPPRGRWPRDYDVAPLARTLGIDPDDTHALAAKLGLNRRTVYRYRQVGLTATAADEWACRAGFHPTEIWPHWCPIQHLDVCPWCGRPHVQPERAQAS